MRKQFIYIPLVLFILAHFGNYILAQNGFDHSYADYTELLKKNVDKGKVDYKGIKNDPQQLDAVIAGFSAVTKEQYNSWSDSEKLAFLINLYNAATIRLVVENYPLKSFKDIGDPWELKVVNLHGNKVSLNFIENDIIRKNFNEPRIHFALVCAANGCPVLIGEAYVSDRLESQLENSTRDFLLINSKNSIDDDKKILMVSPLFDWFKDDFNGKSGSVTAFLAPYFSKKPEDLKTYQIKYTVYDWSLNEKS